MRQEISCWPLRNLFQRNSPGVSLHEVLFHGSMIEPFVLRIPAEPILQAHQSCLGRPTTIRNARRLAGHAIRLEFRPERFRIAEAPDLLHQSLTSI
ncbi:hypothetical protein OUZ56_029479 [Daphnia magna]|uniref:Uncharacterized protein n=1 Tax=Daphnia magna TaxID=35525 RepID=A0ABR0B6Y6_9CRUS|nr:hypothetical protein OUZ56_029479 [Daphnia magna]